MSRRRRTGPEEREAISRSGRLHWVHWAIVLASLLVTLMAWHFSRTQVEARVAHRFHRESEQVVALIQERMELYENVLWSGVAALAANGGDLAFEDWVAFSESLQIDRRYPGINGIGVVDHLPASEIDRYLAQQRIARPDFRIHPIGDDDPLWPIRVIEPVAVNEKAVGLNLAHEANRRAAAEKARDSGEAQITGPIVLVQDDGRSAGFLFYAPYYSARNPTSIAERRETISGLVYAPFIVEKLLAGTLHKTSRHVGIRLSDGDQILYDEHVESEPEYDPEPLYSTSERIEFYGRPWEFDIRSTQSFRAAGVSNQPGLILFGGIVIDALLLGLFVVLSRTNRRALVYADRATFALKERSAELEKSNADLERFAYVASHDLKTPLRGIADLTEFIEEDLADYLVADDRDHVVAHNLGRIKTQVGRMDGLIRGILAYSSLGTSKKTIEAFDVLETVSEVMREHALGAAQWFVVGQPLCFETDAVHLRQILGNLIGNAIQHHHAPEALMITVAVEDAEETLEISVEDNGPGIDARFHDRVFEVFQTLQSKDVVDSTGIGLSIVKKTLEMLGGSIRIESTLGHGTRFTISWPREIENEAGVEGPAGRS